MAREREGMEERNLKYQRPTINCKRTINYKRTKKQHAPSPQSKTNQNKPKGLPIIGEIEAPGFLEGGDFFPAGRDLALVGVGLRSNVEACRQLMDNDLLGARRLAVVRDDFDRHQDRMHLDCVFSLLGGRCCLMLEV